MACGDDDMAVGQTEACTTIKKIHSSLRKEVKRGRDVRNVWKEHKDNDSFLLEYSAAMVSLATIWQSSHAPSENRVEWCMLINREYFQNGGLKKILEKELKKSYHDAQRSGDTSTNNFDDYKNENIVKLEEHLRFFHGRKLSLLDVGSCYNPFKSFSDDLDVLAIDLCPATEDVYKADFLELDVISNTIENERKLDKKVIRTDPSSDVVCRSNGELEKSEENVKKSYAMRTDAPDEGIADSNVFSGNESYLNGIEATDVTKDEGCDRKGCNSSCDTLCKCDLQTVGLSSFGSTNIKGIFKDHSVKGLLAGSFDVIVFSLVLSYMPTQRLRWDCCVKANYLLRQNGLLLLIESDSAHQNRNAHQMRSWKEGLAYLGFVRYRYEKLMHLHCMAYRKTKSIEELEGFADKSDLMFIPQDLHEEEEEMNTVIDERDDKQDEEISSLFEILPNQL